MSFKVIRPKPLNKTAMLNRLRKVIVDESNAVYADYKKTTRTWVRNDPNFVIRIKDTFGSIEFFVGTDNQLYYMLDITGAKEHPIYPVNADALSVPTGFTPKTEVGVIGSKSGGRFGKIQYRKSVPKHPGFEARNFSKEIAKESQKRLFKSAQEAMRDIVQLSGHAL